MSPMGHMKYMLLGGAGIVAIGWLAGMPLGNALYLGILLACPLMMMFMMAGGHGGSHDHDSQDREREHRGGSTGGRRS